MKMAEESVMMFNNNCATNNRNGAEVNVNPVNDENMHISDTININNSWNDKPLNSSDSCTQEEAGEEFLAGEDKWESDHDQQTIDAEEELLDGIPDNIPKGRVDEELEYETNEICEYEETKLPDTYSENNDEFVCESTEKEHPVCLSKMQIMEDVREGCNIQPSSPGHADQRSVDSEKPENGYEENNSNEGATEKDQLKEENKVEIETAINDMVQHKEEQPEENDSNSSSSQTDSNKRKLETDELPVKRLRSEIHENFISRDKILKEFIDMANCNNLEQIHTFSEQLLAEVRTLNELAKEKEREWNNIIHLKKLKEELLLRMQRKRQLLLLDEKADYLECLSESQNENFEDRSKNNHAQSILKMNLSSSKSSLRIPNIGLNGDRTKHRNIFPKSCQNNIELNGSIDYRTKQRPTLDVQSIIADYRQRHPETVPRRGRRIRPNSDGSRTSGHVLNFSSLTLGSGSQVRQNMSSSDVNELGNLLSTMNGMDSIKLQNADSSSTGEHDTVSFKDMLQQFAQLSQSERNEFIQNAIKPPPPYPEVTVHPVPTTTATPTNSLLHGILTKTPTKQTNNKTSFSPTLARLLTAPERSTPHATSSPILPNSTITHPANMSISEILSTSKARNEITITPVDAQYESTPVKGRANDEEETEDSADRLVIDESNEVLDARKAANTDSNSDTDEIPQCQGCNQKSAQFVCAGCGNQWYCSRDCQVSAWDEHSEVCSG